MSIDTSGKWWKGVDADDLTEYLRLLTQEAYPAEKFVTAICSCGKRHFRLFADRTEGCAKRVCAECGTLAYICDSEDAAEEASLRKLKCKCKQDVFELVVAFSLRESGEIKWITVGNRCVACGILGSYVDWKIDYAPTDHLFQKV